MTARLRAARRSARSRSAARAAAFTAASRSRSARRRARSLLTGHGDWTQLRSSAAPASPDFSGWNWVARQRAVLHGRDEPVTAVLGPGHQRRPGPVVGDQRPVAHAVRVHEVEPLVLDAREQRRLRGDLDGVPAHVGYDGRLQPLDDPGPLVAALGLDAVLDAAGEQDLHAHADAEHRPAAGQPTADDLVAADRAEALHARGEGAHAGDDEAVRVLRGRPVGGQGHGRAGTLEGAHGGAEVPRAVVEDGDALHRLRASPWSRARRSRAGRSRPRRGTPGRTP